MLTSGVGPQGWQALSSDLFPLWHIPQFATVSIYTGMVINEDLSPVLSPLLNHFPDSYIPLPGTQWELNKYLLNGLMAGEWLKNWDSVILNNLPKLMQLACGKAGTNIQPFQLYVFSVTPPGGNFWGSSVPGSHLDRRDFMSSSAEAWGLSSHNHCCMGGDLEASPWNILILLYPNLLPARDCLGGFADLSTRMSV